MVHSLLTASLFLLRREAASVSRRAQETQEAGVLEGAQDVVDSGFTGALAAGWAQLRSRMAGAQTAAAAAADGAEAAPASSNGGNAAGDAAAADAADAVDAASARAMSRSAQLLARADSAELWRDRMFMLMLAWVVVEDLLGDVCGVSLFGIDLDCDGYGGSGHSPQRAGGSQPVMAKESVDVLLRLFGSWCQANLFALLGRKDALVVLLGPDKVIFGLVGAVLGGVVVAAAALLRAPQLQVRLQGISSREHALACRASLPSACFVLGSAVRSDLFSPPVCCCIKALGAQDHATPTAVLRAVDAARKPVCAGRRHPAGGAPRARAGALPADQPVHPRGLPRRRGRDGAPPLPCRGCAPPRGARAEHHVAPLGGGDGRGPAAAHPAAGGEGVGAREARHADGQSPLRCGRRGTQQGEAGCQRARGHGARFGRCERAEPCTHPQRSLRCGNEGPWKACGALHGRQQRICVKREAIKVDGYHRPFSIHIHHLPFTFTSWLLVSGLSGLLSFLSSVFCLLSSVFSLQSPVWTPVNVTRHSFSFSLLCVQFKIN